MTPPPELSPDEPLRLAALRSLNVVATPLEERFERITRMTQRMLGVDIAAISLVEADRQYFKSIQGLSVCETSRDISLCGHAILGEKIMVIPDARIDKRFANNPLVTGPPHIVFYAGAPLRSVEGLALGTLCVVSSTPKDFDAEDRERLQDMAYVAESELRAGMANAVQEALVEQITVEHRRALIDPLTRMWNREGIIRLGEDTVSKLNTIEGGAAVVMVDLDNFKQINDTYGHAAGDEVLRVASRRMLTALRESDLVGRLGGDEFLFVLSPCESATMAGEVAERVRGRLNAGPIHTESGEIRLNATMGVRFFERGWEGTLAELMKSSDAALYERKRMGRGAVRVVDSLSRAA